MQKITKFVLKNKVLVIIILIASALRFIGIKPGYLSAHPDEPVTYGSASAMVANNTLDSQIYFYPSLTVLIHYSAFKSFFIPIGIIKEFVSNPIGFSRAYLIEKQPYKILYEKIVGPRAENAMYWSRYINAFIGVISVGMLYVIAKAMFNKRTGLIAALLLATNYRHVLGSHIALIDVINGLVTMVAFYAIFRLWQEQSRFWYIISGLTIGLTISTKFQIFVVFAFLLVNLYIFLVNPNKFIRMVKWGIVAGLVASLVFLVLNPFLFIKFSQTKHMIGRSLTRYSQGSKRLIYVPYTYLFRLDIGILPSLFIILGALISFFRYFRKLLLILSIVFPIFYVFTYYSQGGGFLRNFIPALPLLLILAALGIDSTAEFMFKSKKNLAAAVLTLLVIALPLFDSAILSCEFSKPWTQDLVSEFVGKNLPSKATVVTIPPVIFPDNKDLKIVSDGFKPDSIFTVAEAQEEGIDYSVIQLGGIYNYLYWWTGQPKEKTLPYWDNPGRYLVNTLPGLSIMDLARVGEKLIAKDYRAQDLVYIVSKMQQIQTDSAMGKIVSYTYDSPRGELSDNWSIIGGKDTPHTDFKFDKKIGRKKKGSLSIYPGLKYTEISYIVSPPVKIKPLRIYFMRAWVKTDRLLEKKQRDAFFRLDFYKTKVKAQSKDAGIRVALSSRVYGSGWVEKTIRTVAPSSANYVTIAFQVPDYRNGPVYWIDDIVLFESTNRVALEESLKHERIEEKIKNDYIFPKSL